MTSLELTIQGPYQLAASAEFMCGFTPTSGAASSCEHDGLRLGFLCEPSYTPVVVSLAQSGARLSVQTHAPVDGSLVLPQLARILSLDHDATLLADVAERDPVVAHALAARPGFRPVCFASAYEAALWGVLSQRTPMRLAATLKRRLAEATGSVLQVWGQELTLSPAPERLLALRELAGVPPHKLARCQELARAALAGHLDTERLRRLERTAALAELRALPGIGPWTAELVFVRGAGIADALSETEPCVLEAVGSAYGLERAATCAELTQRALRWRPFRTWISVLLVSQWMRSQRAARPPARSRGARERLERVAGRSV